MCCVLDVQSRHHDNWRIYANEESLVDDHSRQIDFSANHEQPLEILPACSWPWLKRRHRSGCSHDLMSKQLSVIAISGQQKRSLPKLCCTRVIVQDPCLFVWYFLAKSPYSGRSADYVSSCWTVGSTCRRTHAEIPHRKWKPCSAKPNKVTDHDGWTQWNCFETAILSCHVFHNYSVSPNCANMKVSAYY